MRRITLVTVLVAALAPGAGTQPANAAVDDPSGVICTFAGFIGSSTLRNAGVLSGGPLELLDSTTSLPGTGRLRCSLQINAAPHISLDDDECVAGGGPVTGVVIAGPVVCSPDARPGDQVYLCGEFTETGGPTYYFDAVNDVWSTDPNVDCGLMASTSVGGGPSPVKDLIDPIICPILAIGFPPEGDVGIFWDCPPYTNPPAPLPSTPTLVYGTALHA